MNKLSMFEHELEALIGRPTRLRPFVCDGSPFECKVFIVGFNAATEIPVSFWKHWHPGFGFCKQAWFADYLKHRDGRVSNTRRVIDLAVAAVKSTSCLETNLYAVATPRATDLARESRTTKIFEFLLRAIRPEVVVVHGKDAADHAKSMGIRRTAKVIEKPHFSRGWSNEDAIKLGRRIERKARAAGARGN
jgi:hypothetical protein